MAEFSQGDKMTVALMNQKSLYVGSGAPGTAYDGQFWVDTSTDPPVVKVYDDTNSAWMTYHPVYYETQTGAWANPAVTPVSNGTLVVLYNSTQAGTRLYGYSNGAWTYFDTAVAQVYPAGDAYGDANGGNVGSSAVWANYRSNGADVGVESALLATTVTPSAANATVCGFGSLIGTRSTGTDAYTVRLYINNVLVDSEAVTTVEVVQLRGYQDGMAAAAIPISLRIYHNSGDNGTTFDYAAETVAGVSVIT